MAAYAYENAIGFQNPLWYDTYAKKRSTQARHMTDNRYPATSPLQRSEVLPKNASRLFIERRVAPRVTAKGGLASYLSLLGPDPAEGDAILIDVSLHGCQLNADQLVPKDHPFQLIVFVPPYPSPIMVRRAETRWIEGTVHGITFIEIAPECNRKLKDAIRHGPVSSWVLSSIRYGMWSMSSAVLLLHNASLPFLAML
jgi:hypothetical protein